jgi:hypothetical protein
VVDGQAEGADLQRVRQLLVGDGEEAAVIAAEQAAALAAMPGCAAGEEAVGLPTLTGAFLNVGGWATRWTGQRLGQAAALACWAAARTAAGPDGRASLMGPKVTTPATRP